MAKLRDSGGCIAAVKKTRAGNYELLKHDCPNLDAENKYWEAGDTERELFEMVLDARMDTAHGAVVGDSVCKFLIKPSNKD